MNLNLYRFGIVLLFLLFFGVQNSTADTGCCLDAAKSFSAVDFAAGEYGCEVFSNTNASVQLDDLPVKNITVNASHNSGADNNSFFGLENFNGINSDDLNSASKNIFNAEEIVSENYFALNITSMKTGESIFENPLIEKFILQNYFSATNCLGLVDCFYPGFKFFKSGHAQKYLQEKNSVNHNVQVVKDAGSFDSKQTNPSKNFLLVQCKDKFHGADYSEGMTKLRDEKASIDPINKQTEISHAAYGVLQNKRIESKERVRVGESDDRNEYSELGLLDGRLYSNLLSGMYCTFPLTEMPVTVSERMSSILLSSEAGQNSVELRGSNMLVKNYPMNPGLDNKRQFIDFDEEINTGEKPFDETKTTGNTTANSGQSKASPAKAFEETMENGQFYCFGKQLYFIGN